MSGNKAEKESGGRLMMVLALFALLVVGAIVWGIASFFVGGREIGAKALAATVDADLKTLQANVIRYKTVTQAYPSTEQGLEALVAKPTAEPIPANWKQLMLRQGLEDPWGNPYRYHQPSRRQPDSEAFDLWSTGPDGVDGTADDIFLP